MNRFWNKLILPLFNEFKPKCIVEIGCFRGDNTRNILEYCSINDSKLIAIDPDPDPIFNPNKFKDQFGNRFEYFKELSLERLPLLEDYDAVLIDGDHNWYTVYNELKIIEKNYFNDNFPLIILHDVSWPYARRDLYYNPDNIPPEYRHPYKKSAMFPGINELVEIGLNSTLNNAIYENTQKNGVLTAIEDFLDETSLDLSFYKLNVFYGFGLICSKNLFDEETILKIFYESDVIGFLENTFLRVRFSNEKTIQKNNQEIKELNASVSSLNLRVDELDEVNSSLNLRVDELDEVNSSLNLRVDELDEVNSSLNLRVDELREVNSSLNLRVDELDEVNSSLNLRVDELREVNSSLNKKISDLEEINKDKEIDINNLIKQNSSLRYENDSIKEDNLLLVKTNKMFLEDLRDLNVKNQDLEEAIVELKKDYSLLEKEKDSLLISRSWRITSPLRKIFRFFK